MAKATEAGPLVMNAWYRYQARAADVALELITGVQDSTGVVRSPQWARHL
jgi:hypothetical protein